MDYWSAQHSHIQSKRGESSVHLQRGGDWREHRIHVDRLFSFLSVRADWIRKKSAGFFLVANSKKNREQTQTNG